ncbi:MAG: hypothetical protein Kow0047_34000 [Anaerolineae bacterium]
MSVVLHLMAWREIIARVFDGFRSEEDVSPDWLVNPSTNRRLKLDLYFPEIGIAFRFAGLRGQGRKRVTDWELLEEEQRDNVRAELCRLNDVTLVTVPLMAERPGDILRRLSDALGKASRRVAAGEIDIEEKRRLMPMLAQARRECERIISRVHRPDDLIPYAELWRDRETNMVVALQQEARARPAARAIPNFVEGMSVTHSAFGPGTVVAVEPEGDDLRITVQFVTAGQRTLLASLVGDKLKPS